MYIHEIKSSGFKKKTKRVGRGGKRGTYSGRGQKGQKARSGHRIRPAERDLLIRIPKLRGIKNKPKSDAPLAISLTRLASLAARMGGTVSKETLFDLGVLRNKRSAVKILNTGSISVPVEVKGIPVSEAARAKISAAGGSVA